MTGPLLPSLASWPPLAAAGAAVLALLIVATAAAIALGRLCPERYWSEQQLRVRSWWVMAVVFVAAISATPVLATLFVALLSSWALKEQVTLLATRPADHAALFVAFLAIPAREAVVHEGWYGLFVVLVPVCFFLLLPILLVLARDPRGFVASTSQWHWGSMAFVLGVSHLAFLFGSRAGGSRRSTVGRCWSSSSSSN